MTVFRVIIIMTAMIIAALPVLASDPQIPDTRPFHVEAYLCETPQYAIAFAEAVSRGDEDELAADKVSRAASKVVCGR